MNPKVATALVQSKTFLAALKPKQKFVLGASVLTTFGFFAVVAHFVGNSDLKVLYSGLQPAETQEIARRLGAKDVSYELSKDGTSISVPIGKIDQVRMQLASEGLPRSGRQGYEMFDKPNWMGSDFAEKVNYQRALEGELERTIQTLDEVEGVRVHLVMPHESLFTDQERSAKASVVLKLRSGRISDEKIDAITNLVSGAVDNLRPQDVTVVDADGRVPLLSGGNHHEGLKDVHGAEGALTDKLIATLTPVVGQGRVKAAVSLDYDAGASETTEEIYHPDAVAVVNSQFSVERQEGDDQADKGVPGTPSNVPGSTAQPDASQSAAQTDLSADDIQRTENKTYAVSKTLLHTTEPFGKVKKIFAAVLVDDAVEVKTVDGQKTETRRKRTAEELKQIGDIAATAIGIDSSRGDKITVQELSFVALPADMEIRPNWGQRVERVMLDWSPLLKYVGLAILVLFFYFTLLRPLKNRVISSISDSQPSITAGDAATALPGAEARGGNLTLGDPLAEVGEEPTDTNSEVKRALALKRHLVDKIKTEPAATSRLVQNWVRQSEA